MERNVGMSVVLYAVHQVLIFLFMIKLSVRRHRVNYFSISKSIRGITYNLRKDSSFLLPKYYCSIIDRWY
jgi:hypothetical protein